MLTSRRGLSPTSACRRSTDASGRVLGHADCFCTSCRKNTKAAVAQPPFGKEQLRKEHVVLQIDWWARPVGNRTLSRLCMRVCVFVRVVRSCSGDTVPSGGHRSC